MESKTNLFFANDGNAIPINNVINVDRPDGAGKIKKVEGVNPSLDIYEGQELFSPSINQFREKDQLLEQRIDNTGTKILFTYSTKYKDIVECKNILYAELKAKFEAIRDGGITVVGLPGGPKSIQTDKGSRDNMIMLRGIAAREKANPNSTIWRGNKNKIIDKDNRSFVATPDNTISIADAIDDHVIDATAAYQAHREQIQGLVTPASVEAYDIDADIQNFEWPS